MSVSSAIPLIAAVAALSTFLLILGRSPKVPLSRIFLLVLLGLILIQSGFFLICAFDSLTPVNLGNCLLSFGLSFSPVFWIWFSLIFARESYELALRRWRYALFPAGALGIVFFVVLLAGKSILWHKDVFGAISFYFPEENSLAVNSFLVFLLLSSVFVLINLESTFRFSRGNLRKLLFVPVLFLALFPFLVVFSVSDAMLSGRVGIYPFLAGAILSIPMCLAVERYIVKSDPTTSTVYIGRRAVYSSIVLILIGLYLLFIGVVAKILRMVGADLNVFYSILAAFLVIVIFSVVAVSGSIKQRIRSFVDKTFYRGKFDYQREWSELSESISTVLDLDELLFKTSDSISQSLDTKSIRLFLGQTDGTYLLFYPRTEKGKTETQKGDELFDWLWLYGKPITIEDLRRKCKSFDSPFLKDGYLESMNAGIIVPLITKRKLVGILMLGEKKNGHSYTDEELNLLEAMAHQLAIAILNARMSEELLASKEMESFHKVSSFVVHDLKNSISMLSMLLQNAKGSMKDPSFQETALLTVRDAVERMKGLVTKISSPPEEMQLDLAPTDLGQVAKDVLECVNPVNFPKIEFNLDLKELPLIRIDKSQMSKVLQNLMINAIESMPGGGRIDIHIGVEGPCLCLRVSDSGVGMSSQFVGVKLFRPFQTTKKKGLGIGLYQCKEIVEAHGGRIEVESIEGKGTTFKIKLPIDG